MCRLLGSRADTSLRLERDLRSAPNALRKQSAQHPDGWGIAAFDGSGWSLRGGVDPALRCPGFSSAAQLAEGRALIAHVRKASVGGLTLANTHPFVHEGWAFAHNGTVQEFESRRSRIEKAISPQRRQRLRGETDSERLFLLFLTYLERAKGPGPLARATRALAQVGAFVIRTDPPGLAKPSSFNALCSDGDLFLALRLNRSLSYATEASGSKPARTGQRLSQLLVASEPTDRDRRWRTVANGGGLGVDSALRLTRFRID